MESSRRVGVINTFLAAVYNITGIKFVFFLDKNGLKNSQREIFRPHGVHFDEVGNYK